MEEIKLKLTKKYISDDISVCQKVMHILEEKEKILLVAPQGTGKTTFFEKYATDSYFVVSPTRALANQIVNKHMDDVYNYYQAISSTYISSYKYIENNIDTIEYVIFDECHYIVDYYSFAYSQVEALKKVYQLCKQHHLKMVFVTATPETLYCCQEVFGNIDIKVTIETQTQYVKNVYVYNQLGEDIFDLLIKNHKKGKFQIAMINDTKKIEKIAERLNSVGIKTKAISSKNRDSDENIEVFKAITENKELDLDILLLTSWADVGINFINKNITNIYYECGFDYSKGSITSLQQFIARPRNCLPNLYIGMPKITSQEEKFIKDMAKQLHITERSLIKKLNSRKYEGYVYHACLLEKIKSYQRLANDINFGRISKKIAYTKEPFLLCEYGVFMVNETSIKLELHKLIDKLFLQDVNKFSEFFSYNNILPERLMSIGTAKVTNKEYENLVYVFDGLAKTEYEFIGQTKLKELVAKIINMPYNGQIFKLVSSVTNDIPIELVMRKSDGKKIYCIRYIDDYNPYDIHSGKISDFLDVEYVIDEDVDVHDGVIMPYIAEINYYVANGFNPCQLIH